MSESPFYRAKRVFCLQAIVNCRWRTAAAEWLGVGERSLSEWCRLWGYRKSRITEVPEEDRNWLIKFLGGYTEHDVRQRIDAALDPQTGDLQALREEISQLIQDRDAWKAAYHSPERVGLRQTTDPCDWSQLTPHERKQRLATHAAEANDPRPAG